MPLCIRIVRIDMEKENYFFPNESYYDIDFKAN